MREEAVALAAGLEAGLEAGLAEEAEGLGCRFSDSSPSPPPPPPPYICCRRLSFLMRSTSGPYPHSSRAARRVAQAAPTPAGSPSARAGTEPPPDGAPNAPAPLDWTRRPPWRPSLSSAFAAASRQGSILGGRICRRVSRQARVRCGLRRPGLSVHHRALPPTRAAASLRP